MLNQTPLELTPQELDALFAEALEEAERRLASGGVDYRSAEGIVRFVRDVLHADPATYQEDILRAFVERKRVAARGPHGLGKTALASWVVLWGMAAFPAGVDVKIPTTASAWRQLDKYLWPEIRKWANKADWSKVGLTLRRNKELLDLAIKLENKEAFAVASDNAALIEGAHASVIIYVFDEAKAIPPDTWDAAEGAFSSAGSDTDAEAYALAISTPGDPSGRFYDIHKRKPGYEDWYARHVSLEEAIAAGRISREWAEQRKKQWGEKSAVYQNRVEGNFAEGGTDSVIPLRWIELANERWLACDGRGEGTVSYGVDPSGGKGADNSAIARQVGNVLEDLNYQAWDDPMATTGRVIAAMKHDASIPVAVDVIGVGAGVFSRLREQGYNVSACNVAESTDLTDESGETRFVNLRSALWWMYREALDPANPDALALPPDDVLTGDLTAPTYKYTSKGLLQVESKDDIRKRLGRSTDAADAAMLARYAAMSRIFMPIPLDW